MRVIRYARTSDWVEGGALAAGAPTLMHIMNKYAPTYSGRGGNFLGVRMATYIGLYAGFLAAYTNSSCTWSPPHEHSGFLL